MRDHWSSQLGSTGQSENAIHHMIHRSRSRHSPACRRGVTLVELVTVISVSAILLSILTVLVVQMTGFEAKTRGRIAEATAISRLSDHFRADVRAASAVELIPENAGGSAKLLVSLGDAVQVQYSQSGRGIDREVRELSDVIARDRYRLPATAHAHWLQTQIDNAEFVQLKLALAESNRALFRFVAQVGRHRTAEKETTITSDDE